MDVRGETPTQPGVLHTWLEYWVTLQNESGEVISINVVKQDVTERKKIEKEIKTLNESLRRQTVELEKELEAFTYSVSHDLRLR